jgi:hypothetical protein
MEKRLTLIQWEVVSEPENLHFSELWFLMGSMPGSEQRADSDGWLLAFEMQIVQFPNQIPTALSFTVYVLGCIDYRLSWMFILT